MQPYLTKRRMAASTFTAFANSCGISHAAVAEHTAHAHDLDQTEHTSRGGRDETYSRAIGGCRPPWCQSDPTASWATGSIARYRSASSGRSHSV